MIVNINMSVIDVNQPYKVIIGGSGFAGIKLALLLEDDERFDVELISTKPNFEYHAALYRSATGRSPLEVVIPINSIFKSDSRTRYSQDVIDQIHIANKELRSDTSHAYKYDEAYLAFGSVPNYYGIHGMDEYSFSIDSITDTIKFRQHLHEITFSKNLLDAHFIVIGGGASGVELAGELPVYISKLCKAHDLSDKKVTVTLLEASDRLLPAVSTKLSLKALERLQSLGVQVQFNRKVAEADLDTIKGHNTGSSSQTVIWTAGAKNNPFYVNNTGKFRIAKNSRVEVDEHLLANRDVYVIGDSADTKFAGMAQTALHDAIFVAENLKRRMDGKSPKKYKPKQPIYAIPVGGHYAVIQWGRLRITGYPGWMLRRLADLRLFMYFQPFKEAVKTWRHANRRYRGCEFCDENENNK